MNVLSLFDGMSVGQIALNRVGINYNNYFASEIKKHAIKVAKHNYPDTIHIGDVNKFVFSGLPKIDLLIGGSPCQDFSIANMERAGLEGTRSGLFYQFLRVKNLLKPKYWLLENVKMRPESEQQLNEYLGVKGVHINSELVSFQKRPRIYWSNIPFTIPEDKGVSFQDFKDTDPDYCRQFMMNDYPSYHKMWNDGKGREGKRGTCSNVTNSDKVYCLTRRQDRSPNSGLVECENFARYLTRREMELAQTVPVGYTDCVSYRQASCLLGDGWTVDVIAHILKNIKHTSKKKPKCTQQLKII